MTIRTILVHLATDDYCDDRLHAAITLCRDLKAHLIALYVASPVHLPAAVTGRGASIAYLAEARETGIKQTRTIKDKVSSLCEASDLSWEWTYGDTDHIDDLLSHVHLSDLTIISQVSLDHFEDRLMYQLPEKLIQEAGGPVLLLPKGHQSLSLSSPQHVLIPWSYTKESIRAVRDAMPILHAARKVTVLTADHAGQNDNPSGDIARYLQRHNITVSNDHRENDNHMGEVILETAEAEGVDLIVMGGYGRSWLAQRVMGSNTRYIINNMHVPVFMSH